MGMDAITDGVLRSRNAGATWTTDEPPFDVYDSWGRSSNDVYGRSLVGVLHYDGKTWSTTPYDGRSEAFTVTASELLVVRTTGADDDDH